MNVEAQIFAIYDADGGIVGELKYVAAKLFASRQCSLCDISHGLNPMGKSAWRESLRLMPDIRWLHRNEQCPRLAAFTQDRLPMVVLKTTSGFHALFSRDELSAFKGDFAAFQAELAMRLQREQLER